MRSLFGRKKAESQEKNPYEQQQAQEAYDRMTPYQRARADVSGTGPRPSIPNGLPSGPGPRRGPTPAQSQASTYTASNYSGSTVAGSGYAPDRYESPSGYGNNRFDQNANAYGQNQNIAVGRPGGYGGLGSRPEDETTVVPIPGADPNRYRPGPQMPKPTEAPGRYAPGSQYPQAPEQESPYEDEDLTEEERARKKEDLAVREIHLQKHQYQQANTGLAARIRATAERIDDVGTHTLAILGDQGERLNGAEQNLNISSIHAREAEEKTKELNYISTHMISVKNPFTKNKQERARQERIQLLNQTDRQQREAVRAAGYKDRQDMENFFQQVESEKTKATDKYNLSESESDEDDEYQRENRSLRNQEEDDIAFAEATVRRAKAKGYQMQAELAKHNEKIDRIANKTDGLSDHVVKNTAKLRAIK